MRKLCVLRIWDDEEKRFAQIAMLYSPSKLTQDVYDTLGMFAVHVLNRDGVIKVIRVVNSPLISFGTIDDANYPIKPTKPFIHFLKRISSGITK